jgi:diguanylate cyclase (GGDEF)-like protein
MLRPNPPAFRRLMDCAVLPMVTATSVGRGRGSVRPPAWKVVVAAGCAVVAAYFVVPGDAGKDVLYSAIGLAATLCLLLAVRVHRPAERLGWLLLAASSAFFVLGDGVLNTYDIVLHREAPYPSVADALYLLGYPFLFAGVFRVTRSRRTPGSRESWADAAMVAIGALAVSWQFLMTSYAHDATSDAFGRLVTLAYPIMDLAVFFIVLSALLSGTARRPVDKLICGAVAVMLIADFVYDVLTLHGLYQVGNPVDGGFLFNYIFMAAAALHPSMARPHTVASDAPRQRRLWLPLVAVAGFVSPVIILVSTLLHRAVDVGVLAATTVALFTLAVFRASWLFGRLRVQTAQLRQRGESLNAALAAQQELQGDLRHQAFHDSLTGLANRALLDDRIEHALEASPRLNGTVALCICDLDGFKAINDSLGHRFGDAMLVVVSRRLASVVRGGDTVARLGGDEFAILLENVEEVEVVTALAERVVSVLRQPALIDGQSVHLTVSVGVAIAEADATSERLLSEADAAMYEAKASGKDRYAVFEAFMRSRIIDRMTLMNSFQGSLQRSEFFLEYQPQIRLADGQLEGFEALVRWRHPTLGLVGPYRFIPLAEETGFIVPLGRWILEAACVEAADWVHPDGKPLAVSVNLSGRQLEDPNLLDDVRAALSYSGLLASRLVLEITETVLMSNPAQSAEVLRAFREMGIRIAIDDFGVGHSSLNYLRQFPVDILKIDKSFIDALVDPSDGGGVLVETLLRLARDLRLSSTAEGIEHQIQRDALSRLKCDSAQGYLMSRPLGPGAAREFISLASAPPAGPVPASSGSSPG